MEIALLMFILGTQFMMLANAEEDSGFAAKCYRLTYGVMVICGVVHVFMLVV